eukprot:gene1203-1516_t
MEYWEKWEEFAARYQLLKEQTLVYFNTFNNSFGEMFPDAIFYPESLKLYKINLNNINFNSTVFKNNTQYPHLPVGTQQLPEPIKSLDGNILLNAKGALVDWISLRNSETNIPIHIYGQAQFTEKSNYLDYNSEILPSISKARKASSLLNIPFIIEFITNKKISSDIEGIKERLKSDCPDVNCIIVAVDHLNYFSYPFKLLL